MGKYVSVEFTNTINSLIAGFKERYKTNPYYMWTDKINTIVDYYSINREKSTLDHSLKTVYSSIGPDSPFRFNKIRNMYLYGGFGPIETSLENGDFGLEASDITGSTIVLPNTIIPSPGDMFDIKYTDNRYLFKVLEVHFDTLESGANFYKIEFEFSKKNDTNIKDLVVEEYEMILDNVNSTELKSIIRKDDYDYCRYVEEISNRLREYYINLFYSERVDTFIYNFMGANFYDPYVIQFLMNTNLITGADREKYVYVSQACSLDNKFILDYDKSIFRAVEMKNKRLLKKNWCYGEYIDDSMSLLSMNKEPYFKIIHCNKDDKAPDLKFEIFAEGFMQKIISNIKYKNDILEPTKREEKSFFKGRINTLVYKDNKYSFKGKLFNKTDKYNIHYKGKITIPKKKNRGFNNTKFINSKTKDMKFKGRINTSEINKIEYKGKIINTITKINIFKGRINNINNKLLFKGKLVIPSNNINKDFKGKIDISKLIESLFPGRVFINSDNDTLSILKETIFKGSINTPSFINNKEYLGSIKNIIEKELSIRGKIDIDMDGVIQLCNLYNVIIKWFNNEELSKEDISYIQYMNYDNGIFLFYTIPILLYILDQTVEDKLRITKK